MSVIKLKMLWLYGLSGALDWYRDVWKQYDGERMASRMRWARNHAEKLAQHLPD